MSKKYITLKISDSSFLDEDGTLVRTSSFGRTIIINGIYNIILWNSDFDNPEIEFWKGNSLIARFELDSDRKLYMIKTENKLINTSLESFAQFMIDHHPVFANWLIWNPL